MMFSSSTKELIKLFRHTFKYSDKFSYFNPLQRVLTSSGYRQYGTDPEKSSEDERILHGNPFYQKYQDKIRKLQEENKDGFISRIQELSEKKTKRKAAVTAESPQPVQSETKLKGHEEYRQPSYTPKKKLDEIVKLEKITSLSAEDIAVIWKSYHGNKDSLCAVISADVYEAMRNRSLECPSFIYALARKGGYEFIFGQFSGDTCYFTPLINYQTYKEEAPVCLTLNHFTEIATDKGIVLMSGEFDPNIINAVEAQFLANQVQLYYATNNVKRKLLLWSFNKEPHNFNHSDIIQELESCSL